MLSFLETLTQSPFLKRFAGLLVIFGLTVAVLISFPRFWQASDPSQLQSGSLPEQSSVPQAQARTLRVGMNLNGIADRSTEIPFVDAFKSARSWITQCDRRNDPGCQGKWNTKEADQLDLDPQGWVKSLPAPGDPPEFTQVTTLLRRGAEPYPGGQYLVLYDGEGTIQYDMDGEKDTAASTLGRDVLNVTPSAKGIKLTITATDPDRQGNYIRNIRVIPAQYESTYQTEIFNPEFLDRIKPFKALRFMDWMATNHSSQKTWGDRPKVEDATYSRGKGVPLEVMAQLANQLQADPWFNMPHQATEDYIRNFAQMAKELIDPALTLYVEYSNEVWNNQFGQTKWLAQNHPLGKQALYQAYGIQSAQMCDTWKAVFGQDQQRVKCVMGTKTTNRWGAEQVLDCPKWEQAPCYKHGVDALAITAYFSGRLGKSDYEKTLESWIADPQIDQFKMGLTQLKDGSVLDNPEDTTASLAERFDYYSTIAKARGLELVIYEGGESCCWG
ncbi:MAG: cellulose-binding protein [Oscillatoriales cyanobacterium SM2_3_0]|nr:cellulose-binding protein [Oscillatoriales cyanobacterium SM2_3_0]